MGHINQKGALRGVANDGTTLSLYLLVFFPNSSHLPSSSWTVADVGIGKRISLYMSSPDQDGSSRGSRAIAGYAHPCLHSTSFSRTAPSSHLAYSHKTEATSARKHLYGTTTCLSSQDTTEVPSMSRVLTRFAQSKRLTSSTLRSRDIQ